MKNVVAPNCHVCVCARILLSAVTGPGPFLMSFISRISEIDSTVAVLGQPGRRRRQLAPPIRRGALLLISTVGVIRSGWPSVHLAFWSSPSWLAGKSAGFPSGAPLLTHSPEIYYDLGIAQRHIILVVLDANVPLEKPRWHYTPLRDAHLVGKPGATLDFLGVGGASAGRSAGAWARPHYCCDIFDISPAGGVRCLFPKM